MANGALPREPLSASPLWVIGRMGVGRGAAAVVGGALAGVLVVGGVAGCVVGVLIAVVVLVAISRREPVAARLRRERMAADLPLAADLLAACLRAGQPLGGAIDAVAPALGGPLGESLAWVGSRIRLGAEPDSAWSMLARERPLGSLARAMSRAALSGAPVADLLVRLADDARHEARAAHSATARRVGVRAIAPLGLCFLPAFVFLGIVPVVAGLAAQVLLPS